MCLGGGTPGAPTYVPPPPRVVEPGPESPQDQVNNQIIPNANPRDQQEAVRNEFDPPNKNKLKSQSSKY